MFCHPSHILLLPHFPFHFSSCFFYVPYHFPIILICWYKYSYTQCKVSSSSFPFSSFPRCNTQKYKIKIYTKGFYSPFFCAFFSPPPLPLSHLLLLFVCLNLRTSIEHRMLMMTVCVYVYLCVCICLYVFYSS